MKRSGGRIAMLLVVILPLAVTAAIGAWPTAPTPAPPPPTPVASQAAAQGTVEPPAAEPGPAPVEPPAPVVATRGAVNPLRPATSRLRTPGSAATRGARAIVTSTVERRLGLAPTVNAPTVNVQTDDRSEDDASDADERRDESDVDRDRRCRYPLGGVRRGSSCADNGSCRSDSWFARRGPCSGIAFPGGCVPRRDGAFYYGGRSRSCGPDYGGPWRCYSAYRWSSYCGIGWPRYPYISPPIWWRPYPLYGGSLPFCRGIYCPGRSPDPYRRSTDDEASSPLVPDAPIVEATPVLDAPEVITGADPATVGTPIEEDPSAAVPPVDPPPVDPQPADPPPVDPRPVDPPPAVPGPTEPTPPDVPAVIADPIPVPPIGDVPVPDPVQVPVPRPVDPPDEPDTPPPPVVDPPEPPDGPSTDPEPLESEPEELTAPEDEAADPVVENEQSEDR